MERCFIKATEAACTLEQPVNAPYFRRAFDLNFVPAKAELAICGLGFYRLFINGQEITKGALAPYVSNPDHLAYVDVYDAAQYLVQGKNVIGVLLGNGFYNNFGGAVWRFDKGPWVGPPRLALEFTAQAEGEKLSFRADGQFRVAPSPITFDDLRMGEWYDARLELPGWNLPEFDDSGWKPAIPAEPPRGELRICRAEPIRIQREIRPVAIWKEGGGFVYDFGENNAGLTRLSLCARPGQKITVRHGEYLADGKFSIRNIIVQKPTITFYPEFAHKTVYIAKGGGPETYMPSFTYYGFRYAYVEGISGDQATPELLTYVVLHSDLKKIGGFSCSDDRVNRLMEMVERSDLSNFYYYPTDCPHREKNGWTGDARISAAHLTYLYDVRNSYTEWLRSVRKSQTEDGRLPGIVPTDSWGYAWGSGPAWDTVIFELPYQLYRKTGDLEVVRENAPAMVRYLNYIMTRASEDGTIGIGLGDWAPVGKYANEYDTPESVTDTLTVLDAAEKAEEMFYAVGMEREGLWARDISLELRETVRRELLEPGTGRMKCPTQTAQALALYYGVFEPEEEEQAVQELLARIHAKNDSFDGGMLELHTLFHVLARYGEHDLAWHMIMKPEFPSYGYLLGQDLTTLPESFLTVDDPKHLDFSHNHHIFCDVARFFMEDVAGLKVTGSNAVLVSPHFVKELTHARAWHDLPAGRVEVSWERTAEGITLTVRAPENVDCIPVLPETGRPVRIVKEDHNVSV